MFRFRRGGKDLAAPARRMEGVAVRPVSTLMMALLAILLMLFATACGGESGAKTARNRPPDGAAMRVAFVLADGRLVAHDAASGTRLWQFTPSHASTMPSMAARDGVLYLSDGDLYAMHARDGRLLWQTSIGGGAFVSPLTVQGNMVYVESSGTVYAVRLGNGQLAWHAAVGAGLNALLAYGATVYVAAGNAGGVTALDASDGTVRWRSESEFGADMAYALQIADDTLYVGTTFNRLLALNPADGKERWAYQDPSAQALSQPAIAGGNVYVTVRRAAASISGTGGIGARMVDTVIALRASDGSPLWQRQLSVGQAAAPIAAFFGPLVSNDGSTVYAVAGPTAGDVVALSAMDGRVRWQASGSNTLPALQTAGDGTDSTLYTGSDSGVVTALHATDGRARWHAAVWQQSAILRFVATQGTLYVATPDGTCTAMDQNTGHVRWQAVGGDASLSPAIPVPTTILVTG
ncbi:MAG TPA: PQQ-binding-like beta-propeller repeat protein [Ktedonobacterales bacterium]|nr:PQQ-binding-like beta-propeller repeat protein [Ktedonobacterales bacterium]